MTQTQILVNVTQREYVTLEASKEPEIIGNHKLAALVVRYVFDHNGDRIRFVASDWQTPMEYVDVLSMLDQDHVFHHFKDVTQEALDALRETHPELT